MEFLELEVEEFRQFLDTHVLRTFIQTPEMARVREQLGYHPYYVGVKKEGKLVAATMMGSRKTHFGNLEFYAPRGILIDYEDEEVLTFFTREIKKFIKKRHGYVFRIDPYYITKQRDINGNVVAGGIDHTLGISNLVKLGYQKSKQVYQQFPLLFSMDLIGDEDSTFSSFKTLPKRMIKKASQLPITIREAQYDELSLVQGLIEETGKRKNFHGRNLAYYQELYKQFHPKKEIQFLLGELDVKEYQSHLEEDLVHLEKELETVNKDSKKEELEKKIAKEKELLEETKKMPSDDRGKVLLSAGVFLLYSTELVYLFGGNKQEYMHLGSSYWMQWTMIRYGIQHGFTKYNFYGITAPTKEDGVYTFKRGFGGYVEELIGDYELPIKNYYYIVEKIIRKLKSR